KLLLGGLLFTILLIVGISAFLLVSRSQQTNTAALSNADNRAGVAGQLLQRVTEPQAQYAAADLANLESMQLALAGSAPATAVGQEFSSKRVVSVPGLDVVVFDAKGAVLYTTECDAATAGGQEQPHPATATCEARSTPHVTATLSSVRYAMAIAAKPACQVARSAIAASKSLGALCPGGVEGVEVPAGAGPVLDVAV